LQRTYYYNCLPLIRKNKFGNLEEQKDDEARYNKKENFYNKLKLLPRFKVKYGKLQLIDNIFKQKGIDVLMSLDIVDKCFLKQIKHAVVVAGDADFIPAIRKAKDFGAVVHLFCNKNSVNKELLYAVDEVHDLQFSFIQDLKNN
jgi:uncharacterized LabA/DUF88 family protein